jgi:hypothetical protein
VVQTGENGLIVIASLWNMAAEEMPALGLQLWPRGTEFGRK